MLRAYIKDDGDRERLIIHNQGPGEVADMEIELDGEPVTDHPIVLAEAGMGAEIPVMAEDSEISYGLARRQGTPSAPYQIRITYRDQQGQEQVFRDTVTVI